MRAPRRRGPFARTRPGALILVAGALASAACSADQEAEASISTDTFIAAYVDLRMATLRAGVDQIPTAERDRILARHGVTEDDLLQFVEARGRDAAFMHTVWDTIEARIDARRSTPTVVEDSSETPGSP